MRKAVRIILAATLLLLMPGCAWFVLGGIGAAGWYMTRPVPSSESDAKKDRTPPVVTVTSPAGGEIWRGVKRISWTTQEENPNSVSIEVSGDSGTTWTPLTTGIADIGYYDWDTALHADGQTYLVRVMALDRDSNPSAWASPASTFRLDNTAPTVILTSPTGSELWAGAKTITWTTTDANPATASVELSSNHGYLWGRIADTIPDTGSLPWDTLTQPDGSDYRARVMVTDLAGNTSTWSFSGSDFTLDNTPPTVTLASPVGGEAWSGTRSIAWTTDDLHPGTVRIEISSDAGVGWTTAASSAPDTGTYSWNTIPWPGGEQYRVRLTATDACGNVSPSVASSGNFMILTYFWTRRIGGASSGDSGRGIAVDPSGNICLGGEFTGTVDFRADWGGGSDSKSPASASRDAFLSKVNSDGTYGWTRRLGGTGDESCVAVTCDPSGNWYAVGWFNGSVDFRADWAGGTDLKIPVGGYDAFVTRVNADGSYGWTRIIGGAGTESAFGLCSDASGAIYVVGRFDGTVDFRADWGGGSDTKVSAGSIDGFITKIASDGSYSWTRRFGSTSGDQARGVATDTVGNVFVAGAFGGTVDFRADWGGGSDTKVASGGSNVSLTRVNADGSYGWTRKLGGVGSQEPCGICVSGTTCAYVVGYFGGTVNFQDDWGGTQTKTSAGADDMFISRVNLDGTYGWTHSVGGTSGDYPYAATCDPSGNIYTVGFFQSTVDFADDWGAAPDSRTSAGVNDAVVFRINADGSYSWTRVLGGAAGDVGMSIGSSTDGKVYVSGYFQSTVDFQGDWGTGSDSKTSAGSTDAFLTRVR
jgi:hypothetical protein